MPDLIEEPHVVAAGRGAAWWREGLSLFTSSLWTWLGIMVVYLCLSLAINLVPFVGSLGHWLLTPVFVGGLMIGCAAIDRGEPLRVSHLFEGFQGTHFVPLMIIGVVNIGLALAMGAVATIGVLGSVKLADLAALGGSDPYGHLMNSVDQITGAGLLMMLVVLVIAAVFAMLNWFAPAVVALRGASAWEAMKASFKSCLRNWLPFLVYGLVAIVAFIAVMVVLGGAAMLFGVSALFGGSSSGTIAMMVIVFGLFLLVVGLMALFVGPVVFASTYAGYRDTLADDAHELVNPAYH